MYAHGDKSLIEMGSKKISQFNYNNASYSCGFVPSPPIGFLPLTNVYEKKAGSELIPFETGFHLNACIWLHLG